MTPNILIGSRALALWFGTNLVPINEATDYDVITYDNLDLPNFERHDPDILFNHEVERYISSSSVMVNGIKLKLVNPIGLAIIKRSHLWRNLGFGKHITHYHKLLKDFHDFDQQDMEVLNRRIEATKIMFPQGNPSLKQSKEDFFDDYVTKKYDHDYIHELAAFENEPIYVKLLSNTESVWCDVGKWDMLTFSQKCMAVCEETMVIAIERFIVPNDWKYPPKKAYFQALEKVCTTLTSGWFRDFAIDNYPMIVDMFDENRVMGIRYKLEGK
jgi:hypothetical protein